MKKSFFIGLCALMAAMMSSCNDLSLSTYENGPEIAEHVLGMTVNGAIKYLNKQRYCYKGAPQEYNGVEYVFSRDKNKSSFTYEAGEMFCIMAYNDTIRCAVLIQRMSSEESALKLYLQWTRYTAKEVLTDPTYWHGYIRYNSHEYFRYSLTNTYNEPEWKGRDAFWEDLNGTITRAHEEYHRESAPKEIELGVDMNNGGEIELHYETRNFILQQE